MTLITPEVRERMIAEHDAYLRGFFERDEAGQRLYNLLALFDERDGSIIGEFVRAAREGWERSHPDMNEDGAWDEFDRLWDNFDSRGRTKLAKEYRR